ncbi:hypothetical protein [Arenicella xantha]|uniref:WD40 repeat protein n=1 Tax=Arenicella xantha TaxID=644221 RepID=A0A395JQN4_9GAMM|nr:hypothetical protein [Arenicella xantha]RBP51030.1 hypothetical protein DFR28_102449 [Arenicella xantha]
MVHFSRQLCRSLSLFFTTLVIHGIVLSASAAEVPEYQDIFPELSLNGSINRIQMTESGKHLVALVESATTGQNELFSIRLDNRVATKLHVPLNGGNQVSGFKISPNGNLVVYRTQFLTDSSDQLFSVSINGGESVVLNPLLLSNRSVRDFLISPNSQFVVFQGDIDVDERREVYSVPIQGGTVIKLNSNLINGQSLFGLEITPNSDRVIYRKTDPSFKTDLVSVPIGGGSEVRLHPTRTNGASAKSFGTYSSDGRSVLLGFGYGLFQSEDVFIATIDGSTPPLHVVKRSTTDFKISEAHFTLDDRFIIFLGKNESATSNNQQHLFRSDLAEDAALVRFTPILPNALGIRQPFLHPDGIHVVYRATPSTSNIFEVFQIPIAGGEPELLSGVSSANYTTNDFLVSRDGKHIMFNKILLPSFVQQLFVTSFNDKKTSAISDTFFTESESTIGYDIGSSISNSLFLSLNRDAVFVPKVENDELCVPIKVKNGRVAVVCL